MRAVVASLLGYDLEAVPHFVLLPESVWSMVFFMFFWAVGWEYVGVTNYSTTEPNDLREEDSIDGYFYASVPSKNFPGKGHAVVIDMQGVVAHDPSPTKKYQGENVLETGALEYWYRMKKRQEV